MARRALITGITGQDGSYVAELRWLMLQQDRAGDYVIATGEAHSVRKPLTGFEDLIRLMVDADLELLGG